MRRPVIVGLFAIAGIVLGCVIGSLLGYPVAGLLYGFPTSKRGVIIGQHVYSAVGMFWGGLIGLFGGVLLGLHYAGFGGDRKPDDHA
jgi:hypothetical protein